MNDTPSMGCTSSLWLTVSARHEQEGADELR